MHAYRLERDLFTSGVSFVLNCSSHLSFFLFEITFSIFGDDCHPLLDRKLPKKSVRARAQRGSDPGYESKHCLYKGGAGNKFKAKTWRTFLMNHNRSSGGRYGRRVLESIGQSIWPKT